MDTHKSVVSFSEMTLPDLMSECLDLKPWTCTTTELQFGKQPYGTNSEYPDPMELDGRFLHANGYEGGLMTTPTSSSFGWPANCSS